jgi:hypothetical protein
VSNGPFSSHLPFLFACQHFNGTVGEGLAASALEKSAGKLAKINQGIATESKKQQRQQAKAYDEL